LALTVIFCHGRGVLIMTVFVKIEGKLLLFCQVFSDRMLFVFLCQKTGGHTFYPTPQEPAVK